MKRKVAVLTGTRAEYGLLFWLMREIQADPAMDLQVIVTGMHLSPAFGSTYQQIEKDGFKIDTKVDLELNGDDTVAVTRSMGLGVIRFGEALAQLRPDVLVLLGDRFESLAAAEAAMITKIPIAHIHGGEATEGLIDEAIRHSITKMAHIHFAAAEPYKKRILQLGEDPKHVYCFGAPAVDSIRNLKLLERAELERVLEFELGGQTFLVTYHPVTLESLDSKSVMEALYTALDRFPDARVIFTKANADPGGLRINALIDAYVAKNPERMKAFTSLGQVRYFSAMRECSVVLGNSSSGLIEAPFFGKPTVNIGDRQRGRIAAASVIACGEKAGAIQRSLKEALSPAFRRKAAKVKSPYAGKDPSKKMAAVLKKTNLEGILFKRFQDWGKR